MDIINHTVLAWLEEDNQKLGHFRVRPLLRETGPFTPAEIGEWRDDGFIRVVPDKSEQRSCKERMRTLGEFCLLTLTGSHTDKFKPNKNYSPSKGEKNRYIVYSNAVEAVPEQLFYEVVPDSLLAKAVTARVYARQGGKIHGPVDRQTGRDLKDASPLPPDDPRIFSVTLPDGSVRLFYWPTEEAPAKEAETEPVSEPEKAEEPQDAEPMTALDQIKALDRQVMRMVRESENPDAAEKTKDVLIPDDAGTPLYYAQVETETPKQRRNSLAQAVESNRRAAAKPEKKPERSEKKKAGKNANQEKALSEAADREPAQPFQDQLKAEWAQQGGREQLTAQILALPGAREQLAQVLGGGKDPVLAALKAQLQDTEAERLMTVMNLNQAKAQEAQYRETLAAGLVKSERKELDELKAQAEKEKETLNELKQQQADLIRDRERYRESTGFYKTVWSGEAEEDAPVMTVAHRVTENLRAAGFECDLNDALSLLAAYTFCGGEGIVMRAQSEADSRDAAEALARALGGKTVNGDAEDLRVLHGGNAALFLVCSGIWPMILAPDDCTKVYVPGYSDEKEHLLPEITLRQSSLLPGIPAVCPAIDKNVLKDRINQARTPLSQAALDVIIRLRVLCTEQGIILPLYMIRSLTAFAEAAQNLMEGGISAALDRGILIYMVPGILKSGKKTGFLSGLSKALPLTRAALGLK